LNIEISEAARKMQEMKLMKKRYKIYKMKNRNKESSRKTLGEKLKIEGEKNLLSRIDA
jgi:hypothetical protein